MKKITNKTKTLGLVRASYIDKKSDTVHAISNVSVLSISVLAMSLFVSPVHTAFATSVFAPMSATANNITKPLSSKTDAKVETKVDAKADVRSNDRNDRRNSAALKLQTFVELNKSRNENRRNDSRNQFPQPVKQAEPDKKNGDSHNNNGLAPQVFPTTTVYERITERVTSPAQTVRSVQRASVNLGAGIGFRNPNSAAGAVNASASADQYAGGLDGQATASATLGAFSFGLLGALMAAGKFALFG